MALPEVYRVMSSVKNTDVNLAALWHSKAVLLAAMSALWFVENV